MTPAEKLPISSAELLGLSKSIRQACQSLAISQDELAERCSLHRLYVCDGGRRNLSFLSLVAVARGLGLTVLELVRVVEVGGWPESERAPAAASRTVTSVRRKV